MTVRRCAELIIAVSTTTLAAACGGGGKSAGATSVGAYLQALPSWEEFSPPLPSQPPTVVGEPAETSEQVDTGSGGAVDSQQYFCRTTKFSMRDTPDKIVMFSPDRELLWPGALVQGRSHRDGMGALVGLPIRERAPIKVSIPSLSTADNFRVVESPDQAEVNSAIGGMVDAATASGLAPPSSVDFTLRDYKSEQSFALETKVSGKYLGFSASASASVNTAANERTVMVHFVEKMFEVVVEPPQTPDGFFSAGFTPEKLNTQVRLGRIGPDNLPVYVSNIVYGRMMAFTFTSTASITDIKAALNAAYKGLVVKVDGSVNAAYQKTLSEGKIAITSIGGPSAATVEMIASGDWHGYFGAPAPLTTAYPISYTLRNLGDGSIAKVSEATEYDVKECTPAGGAGFVLDSFETSDSPWAPVAASPGETPPISVAWKPADTPQSIFYGYQAVTHQNLALTNPDWVFDVGYLEAPAHFKGTLGAYYGGELSFWYKPAEIMSGQQQSSTTHCWTHWIWYFPPIWETLCETLPVAIPATNALQPSDDVFVYDEQTTADQIILRGGGDEDTGALLTLTYNPRAEQRQMSQGWQKLVLSLSNTDSAGGLLCPLSDPQGCWMAEDRIATEEEIQYVLGALQDFRIRASYPVYRSEVCEVTPAEGTPCPRYIQLTQPIPLGFVGGYFDEIKLTKPVR